MQIILVKIFFIPEKLSFQPKAGPENRTETKPFQNSMAIKKIIILILIKNKVAQCVRVYYTSLDKK